MDIAFASAVLPVVLLLIFVYFKDKYQSEPIKKLIWTFFVGCISVVPSAMQETFLEAVYTPVNPVVDGLYGGYVVAGFSEELWKLLLLMLVVWRSRHFDEYFDGIIYATYLSLGFACLENIMYVVGDEDAMAVALTRGLLAVPAHFLFAVIMGYHLSLAKFDPSGRKVHLFHALLYPTLMHGTYDALLMISDNIETESGQCFVTGLLFVAFIVFDIFMWRWGLKRIKRLQERSHEQNFDRLHPFDGFTWNV